MGEGGGAKWELILFGIKTLKYLLFELDAHNFTYKSNLIKDHTLINYYVFSFPKANLWIGNALKIDTSPMYPESSHRV